MIYYLGLDAGGSTCRVRIVDAQGAVVGEAKGGPANARIGMDALLHVLHDTTQSALGDIAPDLVSAGFGIAGVNRPGIRDALAEYAFGFASLRVESDGHIACLGAHDGDDGAIVIVGTGSIGIIKRGDEFTSIGGHGFPISGEGSGAYIGLRAVTWLYRVMDGRALREPMFELLLAAIGGTKEASYLWVDQAQPNDYAKLAPIVLACADKGEQGAQDIMRLSGNDIGELIQAVLAQGASNCSLIGGLGEAISAYLPGPLAARLTPAMSDPLSGAIMLAKAKSL